MVVSCKDLFKVFKEETLELIKTIEGQQPVFQNDTGMINTVRIWYQSIKSNDVRAVLVQLQDDTMTMDVGFVESVNQAG